MEFAPRNTLESTKDSQEKLAFNTKLATPEDWKTLKDLREFAIRSEDAEMMGMKKNLEEQLGKTEKEWREDLASNKNIFFESWSGSKAIGMGLATKKEGKGEENTWHIRYGYVLPEFRGKGVGKEMFARRLREIMKRGATKATLTIRNGNQASMHIAQSFCAEIDDEAKISKEAYDLGWRGWKIDLNKPEVNKIVYDILRAKIKEYIERLKKELGDRWPKNPKFSVLTERIVLNQKDYSDFQKIYTYGNYGMWIAGVDQETDPNKDPMIPVKNVIDTGDAENFSEIFITEREAEDEAKKAAADNAKGGNI